MTFSRARHSFRVEAKGAKPLAAAKRKKPPPLIKRPGDTGFVRAVIIGIGFLYRGI